MRTAVAIALAALLTGCASSALMHNMGERNGEIRVDPCDGVPACDYRVTVRNTVGIGWDGDKREDRLQAVSAVLGGACNAPELVDERVLDRGTWPLGNRPQRDYVMRVRCPKG